MCVRIGGMGDKPVSANPLGQIRDSVGEQLKDTAVDAAKGVASEPAKILEQILGRSAANGGDENGGLDALEQGQQKAQDDAAKQQLAQKQVASQEQSQTLYKQHQEKLQEEIEYYQKRKQENAEKDQVEEQQEEEKKQIVQLQKEKEDEAVWQQQIKAVQGSHEGQQGKM